MKLILLPSKQEERPILAVIQLRNSYRSTERPAEVVLAVLTLLVRAIHLGDANALRRLVSIVEPVVRVEDPVLHDPVCRAVIAVRAWLRREALDTRGRPAKLCRRCRGRY